MATKKTTTKKSATAKASNPAAKKVTTKKTPAKKAAMETEKYPVDGNVGEAHGKVQLWKDGPYWATTNIGAEKAEDFGYYFWWGDTVGYKYVMNKWRAVDGSSSNFSFVSMMVSSDKGSPIRHSKRLSNVPTYGYGKGIAMLKRKGWITADGVLLPEHDAAHVHWGGDWRMPTEMELQNLLDKCDWTWKEVNGVNGYVVRGKGDYASASIFLPAAGCGSDSSLFNDGLYGDYWSSVACANIKDARHLYFGSGNSGAGSDGRYRGMSLRPVQGFTK